MPYYHKQYWVKLHVNSVKFVYRYQQGSVSEKQTKINSCIYYAAEWCYHYLPHIRFMCMSRFIVHHLKLEKMPNDPAVSATLNLSDNILMFFFNIDMKYCINLNKHPSWYNLQIFSFNTDLLHKWFLEELYLD